MSVVPVELNSVVADRICSAHLDRAFAINRKRVGSGVYYRWLIAAACTRTMFAQIGI